MLLQLWDWGGEGVSLTGGRHEVVPHANRDWVEVAGCTGCCGRARFTGMLECVGTTDCEGITKDRHPGEQTLISTVQLWVLRRLQ